ncbi:LysR family transcriptional regulator [Vibrio sp. FNV 38]|nr:LysR family transcriptional regulator [Vibrio sp. FNV 38]
MFSYEHLAAYCATYEEGSYSKAGRKLNKERTTVREQVKILEDTFNIELFHIQGKKVIPTKEAESLYRQAKVLVKNSQLLYERMQDAYKKPLEVLTVYHDALVPSTLIVEINQMVQQQIPGMRLNWLQRNRDEVLDILASDTASIAIMQSKLKSLPERTFRYINLGTSLHNFYCRPDHPLASIENVHLDELEMATQYLSENHHSSNPELFSVSTDLRLVSSTEVLLELLQHDGWSILSKSLAEPLVKQGVLVEISVSELVNSLRIPLSFYCPPELEGFHEVQVLEEILINYAREGFK